MPAERRLPLNSWRESDARRREREVRVLKLAKQQHGAVSLSQLRSLGLTDSNVLYRVSTGRLHRIHCGVYALGRPDLPAKGRWMAAVLACGPGAVLSHPSGGALHGIRQSAATQIDVTVTRPYLPTHRGIRAHRHTELTAADITEVDGIPVTSVPRTLLDLATTLTQPQLEHACEQAVLEGVFDLNAIGELLARSHGRRGVRRLRAALARGDLGANMPASGLERRFRDLCSGAGLPPPEINRYLLLGDEYHKVDFLWRRQRVVIEVDSDRYHSTGWQRRRDAKRDTLLLAHGYASGRVTEEDIDQRPQQAVQTAATLIQAPPPSPPRHLTRTSPRA